MKTVFSITCILISFSLQSQISLDKSFGEDGTLLTPYGFHQSFRNGVVQMDALPGGQVMMGGYSGGTVVLARINYSTT